MYESITHGAIFVWALIALVVGAILLLGIAGFIAHELFVAISNTINNPENEENEE